MSEERDEDTWSIRLKYGQDIWKGKKTVAPTVKELSTKLRALNSAQADENLAFITSQIVRNCPTKAIPTLLSSLSCHFWRHPQSGEIDVNMLSSLPSSGRKAVCGVVFKKGDLAWNCRTCGKDQTCVQCDKCYRNSNHEGHEVFFHRSSGDGGCCDCGDPEAWAESGNCCDHGGLNEDSLLRPSLEPISTVPQELTRGLRAVLSGAIGIAVSFVACSVRGFTPYSSNPFISWCEIFDVALTGKLHDDEIHSYNDVINALKSMGYDDNQAYLLTLSVDKVGDSVACTTTDLTKLENISNIADGENLLFSIVPEEILKMESNILAVLNWMQAIGEGHEGLCAIVSESLMKNLSDFPTFTSVVDNQHSDDAGDDDMKDFMESVAPNHLFDNPNLYPSVVPQLCYDAASGADSNSSSLKIYSSPSLSYAAHPFERCPKAAFALIVMSSPFLTKPIKNAINSIVIHYQYDNYFKFAFSQLLMLLYPALYSLYVRFIGTQGGNIFSTTVQVFTANSIVTCLSSDGLDLRPFQEIQPYSNLTEILMRVLKHSLEHMGMMRYGDVHPMFLKHPAFKNSFSPRLAHLFRDIDYILKSPAACARILAGYRDNGMLETLLEIKSSLQGIDKHERRTTTHVEREDDGWSFAMNLLLEIENVSTDLISHAFVPFISSNNAWGYTTTNDSNTTVKIDELLDKSLLTALIKCVGTIEEYLQAGIYRFDQYSITDNEAITIRVHNPSDGKDTLVKIKMSTLISKVFDFYILTNCLDASTLYFTFGNLQVKSTDTAESLGLRNNSKLDLCNASTDQSTSATVLKQNEPLDANIVYDCIESDHIASSSTFTSNQPADYRIKVNDIRDDSCVITIRLRDMFGIEELVELQVSSTIDTILNAYATKRGIPQNIFYFMIGERRVNPNDTPKTLSLNDNDLVDVVEDYNFILKNKLKSISQMPVKTIDGGAHFSSFCVSVGKVSINTPLQRVISKLFTYACMGGIDVTKALYLLRTRVSSQVVLSLADYPLRTVSFVAQANSSLWRRNGSSVANLVYNYCRPVFAKTLRYADLRSIQVAMIVLGSEIIFRLAADRFEVNKILNGDQTTVGLLVDSDPLRDYRGSLLSEFLKFLSNLVLYVPTVLLDHSTKLEAKYFESLKMAVAREVVHHVIVGEPKRDDVSQQMVYKACSFGKLLRVKGIVATTKHVTESLVREVTEEFCNQKRSKIGDEETTGYELSSKGWNLIDPEYGSWNNDEQQTVSECIREHRKRILSTDPTLPIKIRKYIPILSQAAIPKPHPAFESIRESLFQPGMYRILTESLKHCLSKDNSQIYLGKSASQIIYRALQLITIQVHVASSTDYYAVGSIAGEYFTNGFKATMNQSFMSLDEPTQPYYSGYSLLEILIDLWKESLVKEDEYYYSGLGWILSELYKKSEDAKQLLAEKGLLFDDASGRDDNKVEQTMTQKKLAAQQRALAAMNKQAKTFSSALQDNDSDEDDESKMDESGVFHHKAVEPTLEDGALECIVCRDKCNEVMGYLCYVQHSKVVKNAIISDVSDPLIIELKHTYRIVALQGCSIYSRPSEASLVVASLEHGTHVLVKRRIGWWLETVSPAGWCLLFIPNPNYSAEVALTTSPVVVQLSPVAGLAFNKHGDTRLHVSSCGHMMHSKCWQTFRSKTHGLASVQLDIGAGERVCPFCKGVCNALLPHLPPHFTKLEKLNLPSVDTKPNISTNMELEKNSGSTLLECGSDKVENSIVALSHYLYGRTQAADQKPLSPLNFTAIKDPIDSFNALLRSHRQLPWKKLPLTVYDGLDELNGVKEVIDQHSLWSATAYTILSSILAEAPPESDDKTLDPFFRLLEFTSNDVRAYKICNQMLGVTCTGHNAEMRHKISLLLSGSHLIIPQEMNTQDPNDYQQRNNCRMLSTIDAKKLELMKLLLSLPFSAVTTTVMPDYRRLGMILNLLYEMEIQPQSSLWSILSLPLLAQDLHVILIGSIANSYVLEDAESSCELLSLARLVQCLIEPACTGIHDPADIQEPFGQSGSGHITVNSPASSTSFKRMKSSLCQTEADYSYLASALSNLRKITCRELQINVPDSALSGNDLVYYILDSWIPFLEFSLSVRDRLCELSSMPVAYTPPLTNSYQKIDDKSFASQSNIQALHLRLGFLLRQIGLPSLDVLLSGPGLQGIARCWANQYDFVYSLLPKQEKNCDLSSQDHLKVSNHDLSTPISSSKASAIANSANKDTVKVLSKTGKPIPDANDYGDWSNAEGGIAIPAVNANIDDFFLDDEAGLLDEGFVNDEDGVGAALVEQPGNNLWGDGDDLDEPMAGLQGPNPANFFQNINDVIQGNMDLNAVLQQLGLVLQNGNAPIAGMPGQGMPFPPGVNLQVMPGMPPGMQAGLAGGLAGGVAVGIPGQGPGGGGPVNWNAIFQSVQSNGRSTQSSSLSKRPLTWLSIGVDPSCPLYDETSRDAYPITKITEVHSVTPFQASITGTAAVFDLNCARLPSFIWDMSHLGMRHHQRIGLIQLPHLYTDIYHMAKFPDGEDRPGIEEPSVCLVCGRVLHAGNRNNPDDGSSPSNPGECTHHARQCCGGTGVFFLVQTMSVLFVHRSYSSYYPSIYLDANGECDKSKAQSRPMFLSQSRLKKVEEIYRRHMIPMELVRNRTTKNSYIRLDWY